MLVLKCTTCGATLELDEAFAGGVCRCIHCGTIQTVPNQLRPVVAPAKKTSASRPAPPVESAPIAIDPPATPSAPAEANSDAILWKFLYGIAGAIVLGLAVLVWLAMKAPSKSNDTSTGDHTTPGSTDVTPPVSSPDVTPPVQQPTPPPVGVTTPTAPAPTTPVAPTPIPPPTPNPPPVAVVSPNFCGVPLQAQSLIYCIDRSSKVAPLFGPTNKALIASLKTLRPDQHFQIIYWGNTSEPNGTAIPADGMVQATPMAIASAIAAIGSVGMDGDDLLKTAIQKAVSEKPELILFISGKATHEMDVATRVLALRGNSPVRIDTILLGAIHSEPAMQTIAQRSGGDYKFITPEQLNQFGK
jgi:hypothetical protein